MRGWGAPFYPCSPRAQLEAHPEPKSPWIRRTQELDSLTPFPVPPKPRAASGSGGERVSNSCV